MVGKPEGHKHHYKGTATGQMRISHDGGRHFFGRESGAGKNRQLLPLDQGVEPVDGRKTGLDELLGPSPRRRVDGSPGDRRPFHGDEHGRTVDREERTVEYPSDHIR
jgi:hypothetical protein